MSNTLKGVSLFRLNEMDPAGFHELTSTLIDLLLRNYTLEEIQKKKTRLPAFLYLVQKCSRTMRKQLDKNLTFHKLVAYMIGAMTGELKR